MIFYAELNEQNVATGVKMVNEEIDLPNHVKISSLDGEYLHKKYENGVWSTEKFLPDMGAIQLTKFEESQARLESLESTLFEILLGGGSL